MIKDFWVADDGQRRAGLWRARKNFYMNRKGSNESILTRCHVVHETPMEALLSLSNEYSKSLLKGSMYFSFNLFKVRARLIRSQNYFDAEKVKELGYFDDHDFYPRHLIRQDLLHEKIAHIQIPHMRYIQGNKYDLWYRDGEDEGRLFMPVPKLDIQYRYLDWARLPLEKIMADHFDFTNYPFKSDITFKPHDINSIRDKIHGDINRLGN